MAAAPRKLVKFGVHFMFVQIVNRDRSKGSESDVKSEIKPDLNTLGSGFHSKVL